MQKNILLKLENKIAEYRSKLTLGYTKSESTTPWGILETFSYAFGLIKPRAMMIT